VERNSLVGLATNFGLDGLGIEFRWGKTFSPFRTDRGANPAPCKMGNGSLSWGKAAEAWRSTPTPTGHWKLKQEAVDLLCELAWKRLRTFHKTDYVAMI
jgi:hypothetical protein